MHVSAALLPGLLLLGALGCAHLAPTSARPRVTTPPRDLVVLVHGMGRTSLSMLPLQRMLERDGYRVRNVGYSSYGPSIAEISAQVGRAVDRALAEEAAPRVHFVTHSLGGIVVRYLLAHDRPARLGRVVMLAPPNQGAAKADRLAPYAGWLLKPLRELRTTGSTVRTLPVPTGVEMAVIAGTRDGKVRPEEARLDGAAFVLVPGRHTFLMLQPRVQRLVRAFLATGTLPER